MFTLFSFLGRKFDALSETSMRRLDYALRVLFVLITAMVLVTLWIMFHAADSDIVPCFFTVIFILFCVDMGVSLKKIKTKEFQNCVSRVLIFLPIASWRYSACLCLLE